MLERVWRKRNPPTLLVGMSIGTATMETSMEVPLKTKNKATMLLQMALFCSFFMTALMLLLLLLQSCPTLCDPIDGSPPGFPIPEIFQARTLEWVAISFSSAWKWKGKVKSFSCVWLLATPWTATHQAPPSMGFSRQEYWSGVPLPSPYKML